MDKRYSSEWPKQLVFSVSWKNTVLQPCVKEDEII